MHKSSACLWFSPDGLLEAYITTPCHFEVCWSLLQVSLRFQPHQLTVTRSQNGNYVSGPLYLTLSSWEPDQYETTISASMEAPAVSPDRHGWPQVRDNRIRQGRTLGSLQGVPNPTTLQSNPSMHVETCTCASVYYTYTNTYIYSFIHIYPCVNIGMCTYQHIRTYMHIKKNI